MDNLNRTQKQTHPYKKIKKRFYAFLNYSPFNFLIKRSLTTSGLAFPYIAFITIPTRYPKILYLPDFPPAVKTTPWWFGLKTLVEISDVLGSIDAYNIYPMDF